MSASVEARVLIVSPVRNEATHLEAVAGAVAAQRPSPARWVVVDDGSTDGTAQLLARCREQIPFLDVIGVSDDRGGGAARQAGGADRLAGGAAPRSFNRGLAAFPWRDCTHIMKLDGDIELPPHYLRELLARFAADPSLGIAGGVLDEPGADGRMRRIRIPRSHVHGAVKCYTRDCFVAIGGVQERLGWDTIDEIYARMRGFTTRSFEDLVSLHHRPLASADGVLRGRARHGACAYIAHQPPLWVALRAVKIGARYRPRGASGAAFLLGYARAAMHRAERVQDASFRRFARREPRRRLVQALTGDREAPARSSRLREAD